MSTGRRAVLVTVRRADDAVDFAIAADVPVFQLISSLLHALSGEASAEPVDRARWRLLGEDGRLLAPRSTLSDARVVDGERLELVDDMTSRGGT